MKKTIIITVVGLLFLAVANFSCRTDKEIKNAQPNETIEATVGEDLQITVSSNASTGYKWELYKNSKEKVVSLKDQKYEAPQGGMIGAAGKEVFTFSPNKKGEAIIILKYKRSEEIGDTKIYKIVVKK